MPTRVTMPSQWQDWVSWGLGLALLLSPWIFLYWTESKALTNAVICGFLLIAIEVLTLTVLRLWEEVLNVVLGTWLIVSPLVLQLANVTAAILFLLIGAAVVALAFLEIRDIRNRDQMTKKPAR